MNKLCTVDPSFLTNKQKLAFWLNIYNFCVMHVRFKPELTNTRTPFIS